VNRINTALLSLTLMFTAILPVTAQDKPAEKPTFKPLVEKFDLQDGDSLVFLGDSITHQCLYTQYVEDYFYTRYPHMRLKIHNAGVGGAQAWDAIDRFDRDIAAYKPKYVTILLGMNDGHYRPFHQETLDLYHTKMTELLNKLDEIGTTPILMTPTMFDSRADRLRRKRDPKTVEFYNSVLAYFGSWLREQAQDRGYGFVDMYSPLNNLTMAERKTDPNFTMIKDAIHPGPSGQLVMAVAILNDMKVEKLVSNINITINKKGKANGKMRRGELSNLKVLDDGIEFTALAESLPLVIPEEAAIGVKLTKLGHRYSREALEVHGLKPGKYSLTIDGEEVGQYGAQALERHIELQANSKTPQYQQAAQVAELNKQRNAGPVREKRGIWSQYQRYARVLRALEATPDDEKLKASAEDWKTKLGDVEARIASAEAKAKELEDQIFEVNQPKPRTYRLTLIK